MPARSGPRRNSERRGRPFAKGDDPRRSVGRPFEPGASGNPGGRPLGLARFIRAETRYGAELAELMLRVLRDQEPGATLRDRIASATWLADRAFGKPASDAGAGVTEAEAHQRVAALLGIGVAELFALPHDSALRGEVSPATTTRRNRP